MTVEIGMFGENALHFRISPHSKVIPTGGRNLYEVSYSIRLREVNGEFKKYN